MPAAKKPKALKKAAPWSDQEVLDGNRRLHYTGWVWSLKSLQPLQRLLLLTLAWEADHQGLATVSASMLATRLAIGTPESVLRQLQAAKHLVFEARNGRLLVQLRAPALPPDGPLPLSSWNHLSLTPLSPLPHPQSLEAPTQKAQEPSAGVVEAPLQGSTSAEPTWKGPPTPLKRQPVAAAALTSPEPDSPVLAPAPERPREIKGTRPASFPASPPRAASPPSRPAAAAAKTNRIPQPWDEFSMPGVWQFLPTETKRQAWNLISAYYAATDRTLHDLTDWIRRRELKIAVDLVQSGVTANEAQKFVAWTKADAYRPQPATLQTLERHLPNFRLGGKQTTPGPAQPAAHLSGSVFDLEVPE